MAAITFRKIQKRLQKRVYFKALHAHKQRNHGSILVGKRKMNSNEVMIPKFKPTQPNAEIVLRTLVTALSFDLRNQVEERKWKIDFSCFFHVTEKITNSAETLSCRLNNE